MFDLDSLYEIILTVKKNKLRTFLTGLAVAWGILMLILLLALGNGLKKGVESNFTDRARNTVSVWPGRTTIGFAGLSVGRRLKFGQKDYDMLIKNVPEVYNVSPSITRNSVLTYKDDYGTWVMEGVNENMKAIQNFTITEGRFLNVSDEQNKRKVIVISDDAKRILFKGENALGEYIVSGNTIFEVVGVYENSNRYQMSLPVYIPLSLAQLLYREGLYYDKMDFMIRGLATKEENADFNLRLRDNFAQLHRFAPHDRSALFIRNSYEISLQALQIVELIDVFIFIVGIASLIAGVVGVSNIMLITVKERTKEIGVRKALGARPFSIISLIISESTLITTVAGYGGLLFGLVVIQLVNASIPDSDRGISVFKDPSVDIKTVAVATFIMIICGALAGLFPALRAAQISPIEAMRDE